MRMIASSHSQAFVKILIGRGNKRRHTHGIHQGRPMLM
jgi:hypothetical protein